MTDVTFYRQKRFDDGLRTGIDVDGVEYWHHYAPGPDEGDSGILWFVDVRLEGDSLPDDPDAVRSWLSMHAREITTALREFSQQYVIGLDAGPYPQRRQIEGLPDNVDGAMVLSAAHRVEARRLGDVLAEIADDWPNLLAELERMSHVA
ncbi:MAG: hypothetical protein WBC44_05775 [Planctomycetaceae bacterium]